MLHSSSQDICTEEFDTFSVDNDNFFTEMHCNRDGNRVKESVGNIGDDDSQTILSEQEFDYVSVNDALHGNPHSPSKVQESHFSDTSLATMPKHQSLRYKADLACRKMLQKWLINILNSTPSIPSLHVGGYAPLCVP